MFCNFRTPLMLAVTNGNSDLAQVLVDHDAQVDCTDKHLMTALHRAVSDEFFSYYLNSVGNWMVRYALKLMI